MGADTVNDPVHGPNRPAIAQTKPLGTVSPQEIHVLLVDDERLSRTIVSSLLRRCNYTVTTAEDGAQAMELLRQHPTGTFHLVLTDVCMPEVNGIQLLHFVKADENLRSVPVVMMSSIEAGETVYECVQGGADEYLVKPVTRKEVQHIWQHVWRKKALAHTVPQCTHTDEDVEDGFTPNTATTANTSELAKHSSQDLVNEQETKSPEKAAPSSIGESLFELLKRKSLPASERTAIFTATIEYVRNSHVSSRALSNISPASIQVLRSKNQTSVKIITSSNDEEERNLYTPPEGTDAGMPGDVYSLGILAIDLLFPVSSSTERHQQLQAARQGTLPARLREAMVHSTRDLAPLQDLLLSLVKPEAGHRPTVHAVMRSGVLGLVDKLGRETPALFVPIVDAAVIISSDNNTTATITTEQQQQPSVTQQPTVEDLEVTRNFLKLMKETRLAEAAMIAQQVQALDADAAHIKSMFDVEAGVSNEEQQQEEEPMSKRRRMESSSGSTGNSKQATTTTVRTENSWEMLEDRAPLVDALYFQKRSERFEVDPTHLEDFARDLTALSGSSRLEMIANVRCGSLAAPQDMVCSADVDAEDRHFATVSVARSVKVFSLEDVLSAPATVHYPVWQATSRSKLSCVAWNCYLRGHLITSDYDGLIQLWDVAGGQGAEAAQFDEHSRRVWSVDFSRVDPLRFVSGSDDGTVRVWCTNEDNSGLRMRTPANVCSVQFHPTNGSLVAAGCANHKVYLYDLRKPDKSVAILEGPKRAVSYVRFIGDGSSLVASSTDSTVRLWDVNSAVQSGGNVPCQPSTSFLGHTNERNFVGLSVSEEGRIACGSENNSVYTYYKSLPFSTATHTFDSSSKSSGSSRSHKAFVSAVCWTRKGRRCLAANSQGEVRVLELQ